MSIFGITAPRGCIALERIVARSPSGTRSPILERVVRLEETILALEVSIVAAIARIEHGEGRQDPSS
jgi:hypothetical protein